MSNVSPELQQLFRAAKLASRPTAADRERLFTALEARLGVAATSAGGAVNAVGASTARSLVVKTAGITLAALTIVAIGVAVVNSVTPSHPPAVASPLNDLDYRAAPGTNWVGKTATTESQSPSPPDDVRMPVEDPPKTTPTLGASQGTPRTRGSLPEEVAILSRAQTELLSGRAEIALRLIAEHERKFKRGLLIEERTTAKIQALCALGRVSEANALLGRLSPRSVTGESARQACTSSKPVKPVR